MTPIFAIGDYAFWDRPEKSVPVLIRGIRGERVQIETASGLRSWVPLESVRRRVGP